MWSEPSKAWRLIQRERHIAKWRRFREIFVEPAARKREQQAAEWLKRYGRPLPGGEDVFAEWWEEGRLNKKRLGYFWKSGVSRHCFWYRKWRARRKEAWRKWDWRAECL
jgi:hypothetical protein